MRTFVLLAMLALASACTRPAPAPNSHAEATKPSAPIADATPAAPAPAPGSAGLASPPAMSMPVLAREAPSAALAVDGEGLRAFNLATGAARPMPFGASRQDVLVMVQTVLGHPPARQGENLDCGAQLAQWDNGLATWFIEGRFVGWSLGSSGSRLTTASGIGLGSTRAELEDVYAAKVAPSSLGTEFSAGALAGLLESARPDARITHLWAGNACIAR